MVKMVLTSSPPARILVAAVQQYTASWAHAGLKKVAMNIVSRVSPLSTKLVCNTCHAMACCTILRRYSIVIVAVTTLAWDPFLVTMMRWLSHYTKTSIHGCKHACHRGTRCQSRPLYKSLKTVRLCRWRWDVDEHGPIRKVRKIVELSPMLITATWNATEKGEAGAGI